MSNYTVGDYITYNTFMDQARRVKVTAKLADVKNGRPGFDGIVADGPEKGSSVWGYDSQVVIDAPRAFDKLLDTFESDLDNIIVNSDGRIKIIRVM